MKFKRDFLLYVISVTITTFIIIYAQSTQNVVGPIVGGNPTGQYHSISEIWIPSGSIINWGGVSFINISNITVSQYINATGGFCIGRDCITSWQQVEGIGRIYIFNSSGNYSFTVDRDYIAEVILVGAGGGGGGGGGGGTETWVLRGCGGSGGGSGAVIFATLYIKSGDIINITVGKGGIGGSGGTGQYGEGENGKNGGDTILKINGNIILNASGGSGGIGGAPACAGFCSNIAPGGSGGIASYISNDRILRVLTFNGSSGNSNKRPDGGCGAIGGDGASAPYVNSIGGRGGSQSGVPGGIGNPGRNGTYYGAGGGGGGGGYIYGTGGKGGDGSSGLAVIIMFPIQ